MRYSLRWFASRLCAHVLALIFILGVAPPLWAQANNQAPLQVLASIRPLALLVEAVAGEAAVVDVLVTGGASPHAYSLRVSDMRKIRSADLVVWLGPEFERFLSKPVGQRGAVDSLALVEVPGVLHTTASPALGEAAQQHPHDHEHLADSHLWLSPAKAAAMLEAIAGRLAELQPAAAPQFQENLAETLRRLQKTSAAVAAELAPVAERPFGVSHDAYGHFADYFGLNQAAAVSAMPDQALSAGHMRDTLQKLQNAHCLIVEPSESPAAVARLERMFSLPAVKADHLALDRQIGSYEDLIRQLGRQFRKCLE